MKRRLSPIACVLLILIAGSLHGQIRVGSEFQISALLNGCQTQPKIAADAQGNFVVVWTSYYTQYGNYSYSTDADIHARRFDSNGVGRGSEFVVNTYTTGYQRFPSVASTPSGAFVVTWQSPQDQSGTGVFGQRFSSAGGALGTEFRINAYTTNDQAAPSVASDAGGDFVVVWHSLGDGDGYGIFGSRFSSDGSRLGTEFQINTYTTKSQTGASVAASPDGNFVVAWQSDGADGGGYGVFGRRFSNGGAPVGTEFQVNSFITNAQDAPSVAMDAAGDFVVVWRSYDQEAPGSLSGIFGQRFSSAGAKIGTEFQVNTYTTDKQDKPSVSSDPNGDFVVVWHSYTQDGSGAGVFGQRFASDGTPLESEFQVNTYTTGNQGLPAVVAKTAEDFTVVWASHPGGIFGQRYGPDLIFKDGFQSNDFSAWSSSATDGGDLSVSAAAGLGSTSLGMQALVDDTNGIFVTDESPSGETRYRARFYFDPNGFDPGEASGHLRVRLLIAFDSASQRLITIVLRRSSGNYSIKARVRRNDGTRVDTAFIPLTAGERRIEFDWQKSTGANDGSLQLFIDGQSQAILTGIDNDASTVDFTRLGAIAVKSGAKGTLYFDEFESRRLSFIGP